MIRRGASPALLAHIREAAVLPRWRNLAPASTATRVPWGVMLLNAVAMAIWSVGGVRCAIRWLPSSRPAAYCKSAVFGREWYRHHPDVRVHRPIFVAHDRRGYGRKSWGTSLPSVNCVAYWKPPRGNCHCSNHSGASRTVDCCRRRLALRISPLPSALNVRALPDARCR